MLTLAYTASANVPVIKSDPKIEAQVEQTLKKLTLEGTAATSWWNNILTGKGDPERGDILVDGPATWKFELTDLSIQLLTEQNGLLLVGDGYTVKKVTIE